MTGAAFPCIVGIEDEDQHLFFWHFWPGIKADIQWWCNVSGCWMLMPICEDGVVPICEFRVPLSAISDWSNWAADLGTKMLLLPHHPLVCQNEAVVTPSSSLLSHRSMKAWTAEWKKSVTIHHDCWLPKRHICTAVESGEFQHEHKQGLSESSLCADPEGKWEPGSTLNYWGAFLTVLRSNTYKLLN